MSFPRYPAYKPSGVEWLGEVPEHWEITKTKHVTGFTTGWTPPTGDDSAYEGENLWANISDLGPRYLEDTAKRISDRAVAASRISPSPTGSLLFSFKLSIGQVSLAGRELYTNEAIATFHGSSRLLIPFAYHAFPLFLVQNAAENIYGAKLLNQELIKAAAFPLPPTAEQLGIATFLDRETAKIDALIAEQQRLIELLQEKRQAVISHAVTKGLNPDAPMKDSGVEWLGEVPDDWKMKRVKHLCAYIEQGWSPQCENESSEGDTPGVLKVGCVNGGVFRPSENKRLPTDLSPIPQYSVRRGDLLVSRANTKELVGSAAVAEKDYPWLYICDKLYRITVMPGKAASNYLALYFVSNEARGQLELGASGASQSMQNISQSVLMEMPIPLPEPDEQERIINAVAVQCNQIDHLRTNASEAIGLLQERRSALISAAVTGQIDVRGLVPEADTA